MLKKEACGHVVLILVAVALTAWATYTINNEYEATQSAHGNETCIMLSKHKAETLKDGLIASITLHTLYVVAIALLIFKVFDMWLKCACFHPCCSTALAVLAVAIYLAVATVAIIALNHVHKNCHLLSAALGIILIIVPLTCALAIVIRKNCSESAGELSEQLNNDD